MEITKKIKTKIEIKTLEVEAKVRYWEDSEINGIDDEMGDLVPFRKDDLWCPVIDIDTGIINNWPKGTVAKIHYKIVDEGSYYIKDINGNIVLKIKNDYVPPIMCPKEKGYGDYIIMDINENGQIQNWNPTIDSFN
jgi:hypothetical protein